MINNLLTLKNVAVKLGHLEVLKDVNASLLKGKITSLIGLNGSGKSTLLRAIVREISFVGELHFYCGHAHKTPDPRHVGYVPQKLRLEAGLPLTVRDFLALPMQDAPIFMGIKKSLESKMLAMLKVLIFYRVNSILGNILAKSRINWAPASQTWSLCYKVSVERTSLCWSSGFDSWQRVKKKKKTQVFFHIKKFKASQKQEQGGIGCI